MWSDRRSDAMDGQDPEFRRAGSAAGAFEKEKEKNKSRRREKTKSRGLGRCQRRESQSQVQQRSERTQSQKNKESHEAKGGQQKHVFAFHSDRPSDLETHLGTGELASLVLSRYVNTYLTSLKSTPTLLPQRPLYIFTRFLLL